MAMRNAATVAKTVERVRLLATRYSTSTVAVPNSATEKRQPAVESGPNSHIPAPMIHLPSGGWTTKLPVFRKMSL